MGFGALVLVTGPPGQLLGEPLMLQLMRRVGGALTDGGILFQRGVGAERQGTAEMVGQVPPPQEGPSREGLWLGALPHARFCFSGSEIMMSNSCHGL